MQLDDINDLELTMTPLFSSHSVKKVGEACKRPDAARVAFEKLRDCAIENLCKSLRAQVPVQDHLYS